MSSALPRGTLLADGRYRIRREVNRGGTAIVYEADDLENGCRVALKAMNAKEGVMTMSLRQVKREISIASSLKHDHIVQLIDVFAEGSSLVLVWELVQGPDLLDLLNACGGRMSEKQAAHYLLQLHKGVTFLHANNLCHRDLKPENCMIDSKTDKLVLIDFGLSKHLDSAVTLGVGTPDYMAPEMLGYNARGGAGQGRVHPGGGLSGAKQYDARAVDVWAMGVMLYLMVAGVYPFEDPNNPDNVACTLQNVRDGRIRPLPADVSHQCADLIVRMLHKKSHKRLTLEQLLDHPWLKINAPAGQGQQRKNSTKSGEMAKTAKRAASDFKRKSMGSAARKSTSALLEEVGAEPRKAKSSRSKSSKSSSAGFNKLMSSLKLF